MSKLSKSFAFIGFFSISLSTFSASIELSEDFLAQIAKKGSPGLMQIEAAFLGAQVREGEVNELFSPELFGRAAYAETNEKAIISFIPIWSPTKQAQLGLRQNFTGGLSAEAAVSTDQRSAVTAASKYRNISTTTLSFTLQMDLWKDLFGRMSSAQLESSQLEAKRAELERDIQTRTYNISLRRLYWSLVANQESLKISEELLKTAQKQASETNQRFRNSVAESDEVARYEAQVASRQGTLVYLEYQKEIYLKQLRNLLPELSNSELTLGEYDLSKTFDKVMACTATIASESKVPYQFTKYDEATEMIRKVRANAATLNSRYDDPDVKLYGLVKTTGVDSEQATPTVNRGSYGGSVEDFQDNNRRGYEVGLSFTMPLGDAKTQTQKSKELYDQKRLSAAIENSDSQVINTHQQLVKQVSLLNEVIRSQKINSEQLAKRLKFMRKKYEQARASVNDLIQDQDALLSSELTSIETKLMILNVLFDYLAIYTETPCEFNRI